MDNFVVWDYLFVTMLSLNIIAGSVYLLFRGLLNLAKEQISENLRYIVCIAVMLLFLIPFYQLLPAVSAFMETASSSADSQTAQFDSEVDFEQKLNYTQNNKQKANFFSIVYNVKSGFLPIWSVGALSLALWYIIVFLKFRQGILKNNSISVSDDLQKIADSCARECKIRQRPILKVVFGLEGPVLAGFFSPIIAIPSREISLSDAPLILRHELIHFKRHDLWWKLLGVLVKIIYWYNPVVWMLARDFEFCAETSCDAKVVEKLDRSGRKHYGYLLISYSQPRNDFRHMPGISFTPAHNKLKRRISIMLNKNKGKKVIACAIVCTLAVSSLAMSAFAAKNQESVQNAVKAAAVNPMSSSDTIDYGNRWNSENYHCRRGENGPRNGGYCYQRNFEDRPFCRNYCR